MNTLVDELYTTIADMDYMDYSEHLHNDLEDLLQDLELLYQKGNGALLNAIAMLLEN